MSNNTNVFTKENLDNYLKELAKQYRKLVGKNMPAEIILIGGAAILTNYGFREMTTDVDAVVNAASAMKDAINIVGDKFNLPNGWLNSDFKKTASYSPKLSTVSKYYKTFSNVLTIRTVSAEYLIAMKLRSARKYKNDLSDIVGILAEHKKRNDEIQYVQIDRAVKELYGSWDEFSEDAHKFICDTFEHGNYAEIIDNIIQEEKQSREILVDFEQEYPNVANQANINDILTQLKKKKNSK